MVSIGGEAELPLAPQLNLQPHVYIHSMQCHAIKVH
jgi:hypothetical protein